MIKIPDKNTKITLLGLGLSNYGAAQFLHSRGYKNIFISELKPALQNQFYPKISPLGIAAEFGGHTEKVWQDTGLVLISPGFPPHSVVMAELAARKIPILSDIEFVYRFFPEKKFISVTGSNGKSTTTALIHHILRHAGLQVSVGGNIGIPICEVFQQESDRDYFVIETSSYELEYTEFFKPAAAVFLNLSPNHLEHHGTLDKYLAAKAKSFTNQDQTDLLVHPDDSEILAQYLLQHRGRRISFGFNSGRISWQNHNFTAGGKKLFSSRGIQLLGRHNLLNVMAALGVALDLGITAEICHEAVKSFQPLEHRLETVKVIRGITLVNDSKSTTIDSMVKALESFPGGRNVILLAGGRDKLTPLEPLSEISASKLKSAILFGEAGVRFHDFFNKICDSHLLKTMDEALVLAMELAERGDFILLSPGCSSFDQFQNFEARGEYFKQLVSKL
ncbi:MAG: UDP-N-acetylmuramoyl-L-alanine--D-glutamate ligase [Candidatus Wallbacteria bacterium]|nr:UDP-N-acetylmuramoyl-L-alanine--D-glutamate ligase [Candidatus Wallbacteria bacterium]